MTEATLLGWAVCANISDHLRAGREPGRFYQGTRMFSPGAKVWLGEAYWGVAGECLHVIGLRRISRDFVNCIVTAGVLTNLRVAALYSPKIWATLQHLSGETFDNQADATVYLSWIARSSRDCQPEKLHTTPTAITAPDSE